jgi:hypothetical protein
MYSVSFEQSRGRAQGASLLFALAIGMSERFKISTSDRLIKVGKTKKSE